MRTETKIITEETDPISDLPEVVLQHILSFLSTIQIVQSIILCTQWRHMWTTFPVLRFDKYYFNYFDLM